MIEKDRQKAGQEILGIRKISLYPKSGSWNCHGVTESTEPVEKRAPFRMLYPHTEGNNFSRPFEGVAPYLPPLWSRCLCG